MPQDAEDCNNLDAIALGICHIALDTFRHVKIASQPELIRFWPHSALCSLIRFFAATNSCMPAPAASTMQPH